MIVYMAGQTSFFIRPMVFSKKEDAEKYYIYNYVNCWRLYPPEVLVDEVVIDDKCIYDVDVEKEVCALRSKFDEKKESRAKVWSVLHGLSYPDSKIRGVFESLDLDV